MLRKFIKKPQNLLRKSFQPQPISHFSETNTVSSDFKRGNQRQSYSLKEGDLVSNFKVEKIEQLEDFQLTAYHLEHQNTATKFLHIDTPDLNNCMAIIFKTLPDNDKGTPHILEHLACCGGEKYPVRDPFMKMLKRSLNTYMNAWTGPDFTAYPFASQNKKDFQNLMSVYMDISLKALLKKTDFLQEGWRYDFDSEGKLEYKGVVFNEMKGVMQTQDNILNEVVNKHLYNKESVYYKMSGGNPPDITDLSYQEIRDFYQKYYHPSNAKIFSYGDLNFLEHLEYLDKEYFNKFERQEPVGAIETAKKLEKPKKDLVFKGPPEVSMDENAQAKFGFSFLCNNVIEDPLETLGLQVLSYLLFQQPNGPLYKALIESGVAPAFIGNNGYDSFGLEGSFTIGVSDIKEEDAQKVEDIIFGVLRDGVVFDEEIIESVLHMIELDSKVVKGNFGLNILMQVLNSYNHDSGKVLNSLEVTKNMQALKEKILKENFLQQLSEKYLLNNEHFIRYKMLPEEEFNQNLEREEKEKLEKIQNTLTQEEIEEIKTINLQLQKEQDSPEDDADKLPSLDLKDIELKVEHTEFENKFVDDDIPVYFTKQATNGLTYLRMKIDLQEVPLYVRQYLDMFTTILTQIGSEKYDKEKLNTLFNLYTSGFNVYYEGNQDKSDPTKTQNYLVFSIACMDRNIEKMMQLFGGVLCTPNFQDYDHIVTVIKNTATQLGQNIVDGSMNYAMSVAQSSLREKYFINEKLMQTEFICQVGKNMGKSKVTAKLYMQDIEFQLLSIMRYLMKRENMSFAVHSDKQENFYMIKPQIDRFLDKVKIVYKDFDFKKENSYFSSEHKNPFETRFISNYYSLPMQVNYVVQSMQIPHYTHEANPRLNLVSELLSNKVLHREIREKGGAYGGGSKIGDCTLNFYSYRDPNTLSTLKAYEKSIEEICRGEFNEQDIKDAKLCVFQKIDKVITPQNKGLGWFLNGVETEDKITYRERLLDASKQDLIESAQVYLEKAYKEGEFSRVIFGVDSEQEMQEFKNLGWNMQKVLDQQ